MRQPIKTFLAQFVLLTCLLCQTSYTAHAQLWENALDSIGQIEIDKKSALKATPPVQEQVDDKVNEYRLLMLSHEWWGVPTRQEQERISRATESRFKPYNTQLEDPSWRNQAGVLYETNDQLYGKQNLTIMGWHPYWEGNAYKTYNYRLLTHVAYYGYEVNPFTGGYNDFEAIYSFLETDMIMTAHIDSCKVLLTVSNRGYDNNEIFFTSEPDVQRNLIDSLRQILRKTNADGIDLNFDEVPIQFKSKFIAFVKELSFALREDNNDYTISMSVPIYDEDNVYDLGKLKPWIDLFVIGSFNFHIQPSQLKEGPLAPLLTKDAPIRGTTFLYEQYTTLDELLASPYDISEVTLEHPKAYEEKLKDSLNYYIRYVYSDLEYKPYDLTDILNTIKITKNSRGVPLWKVKGIRSLLNRTNCYGVLTKNEKASKDDESVGFFIFKPKKDTLKFKELEFFKRIAVESKVDSTMLDLKQVVDQYIDEIGPEYASSLVLGLPYHGAVWYKNRDGKKEFEGYIPYSEILKLVSEGDRASVDYDKGSHSLIATIRDAVGGVYKIYFDNSTSLSRKYNFSIREGLGGVGLWALGADYAHTGLWSTIEECFVTRRVPNPETNTFKRVSVEKGNKVSFTIQYLLKRFSNLIFATIFFITIFICISFAFSVLDWKVRDVLFYSGAFRIFYLVLFTIVILVLGNWMGWFENKMVTFTIGTCLGLLLTWVASDLVQKKHEKLP